ncbi:MAG TPA: polyphosphate kinase 1 [Plasticicumulans sp.]|uniref:polyphosphate kinase 1 n=1 Tax=Plasticicumulans sp. TaxID=2307179 RepID=UPI002CF030C0|nr:polyphosphate kinase 1 [Plasticicumulans sp.]HMZ10754.1 polyphosphate kinase 1 [Plasticicumulans sp.]HNF64609.1 polyphosphate kinase 1 [Plasticicumulans sp.]HNG49368.1 polyphosphate kinase 1 [Plasticicumulans sp.]HNK31087.1 polyphosphate kinase 1 [Plasticicumulans sp.]HNM42683.1 polyphosphate kinase 1 [Plasticicumulans sp.]
MSVPPLDPLLPADAPAAVEARSANSPILTVAGPAETPAIPAVSNAVPPDLDSPELYLNRELTWLAFNRRVLHEAEDARTPLLERVKFLAIVSSNLDEFFMKRIGGLKQQIAAGVRTPSVDGRMPRQQLSECYAAVREINEQMRVLSGVLHGLLIAESIHVRRCRNLTPEQQADLRQMYIRTVLPLVTPQAMDPAHPFPFISNLSLNLLVTVRYPHDEQVSLMRVKVPTGQGVERLIALENNTIFVPLEDVMAENLDLLVPGMVIEAVECFRVTRNAVVEADEDQADDLLLLIESELRERRFAPTVRLEVNRGMDPVHRGMLAAELGLDEDTDVFDVGGMMAMRDLFQIAGVDRPELHDTPHGPLDHPKLAGSPNIFHAIRDAGTILLQHPYESFATSVERFLREAARDPKVLAIKMTLYRTSADARIIQYLVEAARNGKQVAVVVELKARFDEAANIRWAERMEEAGIHVNYGVVGLKTHAKVIFVVRRDYSGLRRYAHIGTGNYHPGTARLYTDLGLLTADEVIGDDLMELFNYLTTGFTPKRNYRKLLPAPKLLKPALLDRIEREIRLHTTKNPGLIQFKMNALEDADIVRALYRAAQAGVRVDLIVRDTCRLRPGLPGISESVRVISIVGRFLEHPRLFYFRNGGHEEYFIGSADCMKRNLESRVEVVAPVEHPEARLELRAILDTQLNERRSAWDMQSDGSYVQRTPSENGETRGTHELLIAAAEARTREATRLKKRRPKAIAKRSSL